MSKNLIIAEKASVAKDIAAALGGFETKKQGSATIYERADCIVGAASGHLVELAIAEGEDPGKELHQLPAIPERFKLEPRDEKSRSLLLAIKQLMARPDVTTVINACDAGREGELIFRYVYMVLGGKKPMKRMWLQSMTPQAIREGYGSLRTGESMESLFNAARSRAEADFLIGINTTRGLSKLHQLMTGDWDSQNGGRVAFPTLAIVVEREEKIRTFKPRDYWEVRANFGAKAGAYLGTWFDPNFKAAESAEDARDNRIFDKARADAIVERCRDAVASDVWEKSVPTQKAPPSLFDLTTLQREANGKFGLSASDTLKVAQSLYETHKVLTYPRTDAKALPEDYVSTAADILGTFGGTQFEAVAREAVDSGWVKPNKHIFDNSKISDHFAIIPTMATPSGLSPIEQKIYDLVVRRFIAAFFPAAEFNKVTRITTVLDEKFKSSGSTLLKAGWLKVYGRDDAEDKDANLVAVETGELPPVNSIDAVGLKTKAPERFNDATLLSAMEHAGRNVDDAALREAMASRGLGTPATRAATIEKLLLSREKQTPYLKREGKELVPQEKAMKIIKLLRENGIAALTEPDMTGEWEFKLKQIEAGQYSRGEFMAEIKEQTRLIINKIKERARTVVPPAVATLNVPCPKCQGAVQIGPRFYECTCGFKVWRDMFSRKMEQSEIEQLLSERQTAVIEGFKSPNTGKKFACALKLPDDLSQPVQLVFPDRAEGGAGGTATVVGACPKCQGKVVMRGEHYFCEKNTRENPSCDFKIWGEKSGKKLTQKAVEALLSTGRTGEITGFKSAKGGKTFSAVLKLSESGLVEFDFGK